MCKKDRPWPFLTNPQESELMGKIQEWEICNSDNWIEGRDIMRPITLEMVIDNPHFKDSKGGDELANTITKQLKKALVKRNVSYQEYDIHCTVVKYLAEEVSTPVVFDYLEEGRYSATSNEEPRQVMIMERIQGQDLATMYGEEDWQTPHDVHERCRAIIDSLRNESIFYNDITSYNFMMDDQETVVVVDFGHAKWKEEEAHHFIQDYLDGENGWNPDFR